MGIEVGSQPSLDEGQEVIAQERASGHPLVVVSAVVVVRPVEPATREGALEPIEHGLMAHVHSQRDLRLSSIPPEVAFSDEQSNQYAFFEFGRHVFPGGWERRSVPSVWAETAGQPDVWCFTVWYHVKREGSDTAGRRHEAGTSLPSVSPS